MGKSHHDDPCSLYCLDILDDGNFATAETRQVKRATAEDDWSIMIQQRVRLCRSALLLTTNKFVKIKRPSRARVRALFADNLSGPVLQMLGTK